MKQNNIYISIALCTAFLLGNTAFAGTATVSNSVTTEANAGGSGGTASVSTEVKTIINGKVVEDYSETKTSENGEDVSIEYESHYDSPATEQDTTEVLQGDVYIDTGHAETEVKQNIHTEAEIQQETDVSVFDTAGEEMALGELSEEAEGEQAENRGLVAAVKLFFKTYVFWWL